MDLMQTLREQAAAKPDDQQVRRKTKPQAYHSGEFDISGPHPAQRIERQQYSKCRDRANQAAPGLYPERLDAAEQCHCACRQAQQYHPVAYLAAAQIHGCYGDQP